MSVHVGEQPKRLHLAIVFMARRGGISQTTCELARALEPLARVTCYLSIYNEILREFNELPCQVKTFPTYRNARELVKSLVLQSKLNAVANAILRDRPDVVIDTGSGPWRGLIQKRLKGKAVLAEVVHDVELHPDRWYLLTWFANKLLPSRADLYVALSRHSFDLLGKRYPRAQRIESRHGIIHASESIDSDAIAARRHRMLFFGRIERYKGVDVLVRAYEIARSSAPDLQLSIVGSGPIDPKLRQEMHKLGINVRNEWVCPEEVAGIFESHGVVLMPYTSATQSGVASIAIARGMPAIATSVGALPEQVIDGRNGLVVPPGDAHAFAEAMLKLANSELIAREMSREALRIAREVYSWDVIAKKLLNDLNAVLAQSRRSPL